MMQNKSLASAIAWRAMRAARSVKSLRFKNLARHWIMASFDMRLFALRQRIFNIWREQERNWDKPIYWAGWFYQSMPAVGIYGWRDTEKRIKVYKLTDTILPHMRVLDIGANCGFIAISIASHAAHWTCIEPNPYLCRIGREVLATLKIPNIEFIECGFEQFNPPVASFDIVCSFAAHDTYDKNSKLGVDEFFDKIAKLLTANGILLFESHNDEVSDAAAWRRVTESIARHFDVEDSFSFISPELVLEEQRNTGAPRHFIRAQKRV